MSKTPTLREMMEHGVHFGHVTSRWHPKMKPFIYGAKDNVHIINLEKTKAQLEAALQFLTKLVEKGGIVLFVGTKSQARDLLQAAARDADMPYVSGRWCGGTLTNFTVLRKNVKRLEEMEARTEESLSHLTKKERLQFEERKRKLESLLDGVRTMSTLPQALFVVDARHEDIAVAEARLLKIPVVGIVDTNTDPGLLSFPIPANDDASASLNILLGTVGEALREARTVFEKSKTQLMTEGETKQTEEVLPKPKRAKVAKAGV